MNESSWHERWREGRIGFHQDVVHGCLERFWPRLPPGTSVLVPLCGKSLDMLWLEQQGLAVTGVELVEQAAEEFCQENALAFSVIRHQSRRHYQIRERTLQLIIGDFFRFVSEYRGPPFGAIYDRAALAALPAERRRAYVRACQSLLGEQPAGLLITLEYPQELMPGPPFSVPPAEIQRHWPGQIECVSQCDVIDSLPKAREFGVPRVVESCWRLVWA